MQDKDKYHSTKAYRIYPLYYNLFYSCHTIVYRDNLSDYLIRKYYNFKDIPRLYNDNKGNLLEKIILDLYEKTDDASTVIDVLKHPRMVHLEEYYRYKGIDINKPRKSLAIRISDDVDNKIRTLGRNVDKIGGVVEIAIAYHIVHAPSSYYDLITFIIQNQAEQQHEKN